MPLNRSFFIRVLAYNECLLQREQRWTKELLVARANERLAMHAIEPIKVRQFAEDKREMVELWQPPLRMEVYERKYYRYAPGVGLPNVFFSAEELDALLSLQPLLHNVFQFDFVPEIRAMMQKVQMVSQVAPEQDVKVEFDHNQQTPFADTLFRELYDAIRLRRCLDVEHQSFSRAKEWVEGFSPRRLKQSRHRWFVVGLYRRRMFVMGLERILSVSPSLQAYDTRALDIDGYFAHLVGVTKPNEGELQPEEVLLAVRGSSVPYVLSKKIHPTAQVLESGPDHVLLRLHVKLNYELETLILGYADHMRVLTPERLRQRVHERLLAAAQSYAAELPTD